MTIQELKAELRWHIEHGIAKTIPLDKAEASALLEHVEGLERDARRYRWLRDPCSGAENVVHYCRGDYGTGLMSWTMLDEAIDAAIEDSKSHD